MNRDQYLSGENSEGPGDLGIINALDALDLQIMISGPQSSHFTLLALDRLIRHMIRLRPPIRPFSSINSRSSGIP